MNKGPHSVQERAFPGSADDRRVRRTTQALIHALVALLQEKRYDAVTIQDLLDHADVGRSTFYSHYRGKDDLLLGSFEHMLERLDKSMGPADPANQRLAPVRELFAHVGESRSFHRALVRGGMLDRLYQAGANQLSRTIEHRLGALPNQPGDATVPRSVTAQALAGSLFGLLRWWVDHETPYSAKQMDEMFHTIWSAT